ncbi:putative DNA repair protein [Tenacibaculum maritimum]|uniref:JAB domain-containing protein n=1 Tax=Tenacibaculum maritimum TaxID=107401 RepID=UPI0012E61188|nr:JAB domain-containing protein [Tenacibaculum maritimum]CAA0190198.1 putative DNA repair protein [Tenacibaculum maritimum]
MEIAEIKVSYTNNNKKRLKITNSKMSYDLLLACWNKHLIELQEEFKVLLLNNSNQVLGIYPLVKGGSSAVNVDAKLVFSVALKCNAKGIILAHNHPSGNLKPSEADKTITQKLKKAGEYLDIAVLDHLIITKNGFYSFNDKRDYVVPV